jgi:acyl-CoA dehydrogenase
VALLGGGLKTKQKLTGRLADALSELYLLCCVAKRFEDDGRPASDRSFVALAAANGLTRFEAAIRGTIDNFPIAPARVLLRLLVFPLGRHYYPASDRLASKAVRLALEPGAVRDRLTRYIFISDNPDDATGLLELTLKKVIAAEEAERKLERAIRAGHIRRYHGIDWIANAAEKGILTESEAALLRETEALVARVIAVDDFDPRELKPNYQSPNSEALGHNSRSLGSAAAE